MYVCVGVVFVDTMMVNRKYVSKKNSPDYHIMNFSHVNKNLVFIKVELRQIQSNLITILDHLDPKCNCDWTKTSVI